MPIFDAVIQLPERDGIEYYVFAGGKVAIMHNKTDGYDKLVQSPKNIRSDCPILSKTGWGSIDAVVPVSGVSSQFYFFHGAHYIRATLDKDLKNTEENIRSFNDQWKGMTKEGIYTIDAGVPINDDETYFFSGTRYVKYNWTKDKIERGPRYITSGWIGLKKAGFERVDAMFPSADQKNIWYVFRGDQYVRIKWDASEGDDSLEAGPFLIAEEFYSFKEWP